MWTAKSISPEWDDFGRLMLWYHAVLEAERLLDWAQKCEIKSGDESLAVLEQEYWKNFDSFRKTQDDYEEGVNKLSHMLDYQKQKEIHFPRDVEFSFISKYLTMLAVVIFCQILNDGSADKGKAASNDKAFRAKYRRSLTDRVFNARDEKKKFNKLCASLLDARNKMIGHADASMFKMSHQPHVSGTRHLWECLDHIDLVYWREILEPVKEGVRKLLSDAKPFHAASVDVAQGPIQDGNN